MSEVIKDEKCVDCLYDIDWFVNVYNIKEDGIMKKICKTCYDRRYKLKNQITKTMNCESK